jgi:hypothetical protein
MLLRWLKSRLRSNEQEENAHEQGFWNSLLGIADECVGRCLRRLQPLAGSPQWQQWWYWW